MLNNIYVGSDSKGYTLKKEIIEFLHQNFQSFNVVDLGVFRIEDQIELPVLAQEVGEKVVQNQPAIGILIDSEGSDLCDFSKEIQGLHPVLCKNLSKTELDDDSKKNILCIASSCTPLDSATQIISNFISNRFQI